jgi:uncharacterized protein (TIGR02231 family)
MSLPYRLALFLGVALATLATARAQQPANPPSRISHVTVYPGWAYVTRTASLELKAGTTTYTIPGLPAWIDDDSVRARVDNPAVQLLFATSRQVFRSEKTEAELRQAEAALTAVQDQRADLEKLAETLATERTYLAQLMTWKMASLPQESAPRKITPEELAQINALAAALTANDQKTADAHRKARDLAPTLAEKEKALAEVRRLHKIEARDLTVQLAAASDTRVTLQVDYLINGASWYPSYDAASAADRAAVKLGAWAVVQQSTGESWDQATYTLATINPYATQGVPELQPWVLANVQTLENAALGSRLSSVHNAKLAAVRQRQLDYNASDEKAQQTYGLLQANVAQAVEVVRQAEARGTTAVFTVPAPHTIKSDGLPAKLPLGEAALTAELRYVAVPVVSSSTYVTGRLQNAAAFPLLPGPVHVFLAGSLIGKAKLDLVAQGEHFDLYLGLEDRIKVTRELDGRNSSTALLSGNKRLNLAYRLTARSFLATPATLEVRDQVPIAPDGNVRVRLLGSKPSAAQDPQGLLTWTLPLAKEETKAITYEFQVESPEGLAIGLVNDLEQQVKAAK